MPRPRRRTTTALASTDTVESIFLVPFCSTLDLDDASYEWFLRSSGVLADATSLLTGLTLDDTASVEIARRQIQSLLMAAEVQYIVESMTA